MPVFLPKKEKNLLFELLGAEAFAMFTQCRNVCAKGTETFRLLPLKGQAVLGPIASSPWRSNFSFTPLLCGRLIALAA